MLTIEQLKKYYSEERNVSLRNLLVEYLQHEVLDSIYKQKESASLSFMGGTAIRIVYSGNRFSEDLDFDNFGLDFSDFEKLLGKVVEDMRVKGFQIEFRLVEKGAYHCHIKFPHILQSSGIESAPGEKILIRIDTVKKEKIFIPEMKILNRFDIYRNILVNPVEIILAQKLITILERKREKGRDFYDTSYLYGKTQPDFACIEKTLGIGRADFVKKLLKHCDGLDFNYLAKDVAPFLLDAQQSIRVLEFNNFIKSQF
ncbi:MAG: nucleotidyl transferase AbiEii/AbiGii toxin family protein [Candidatus Moraniibacteriota bacterium]